MSHFSCFFFRKRRNKRNQTEREKRRKATAVSLGALEKRLFRIKCSDRFSSLRRDCGIRTPSANPTVPDLLVYLGGGRWVIRTPFTHGFVQIVRFFNHSSPKTMLFRHRFAAAGCSSTKTAVFSRRFCTLLEDKQSVENPFI